MPKELPMHLVVQALERNIVDIPMGKPAFADPQYNAIELSSEYFAPLPKQQMERKIAFVDGGSAEIISAPNFAVGLNRLYFNLFNSDKRLEAKKLPQRIDFYTVCFAKQKNDKIFYETELVPLKKEWSAYLPDVSDLKLDSLDRSIMTGQQRAPISRVLDIARLFGEWSFSRFVISEELDEGDVLVRDGTLQTVVTNENIYANKAYESALSKKVYFAALSKTSTLLTKTGQPLLSAINLLSESSPLREDAWYYYPIVEISDTNHQAEMFAVKLHKLSDYVFRFEVLKNQVNKRNLGEVALIISSLAKNSRDLCFPGYPYGLMDADKFARVSGTEKSSNQFQFKAITSGKVWKKISMFVKSSDAHEILNKL